MGIQQDIIKYYGEIWRKMNQDSDLRTLQKMNPLFAIRQENFENRASIVWDLAAAVVVL
jgi:hypothetical protein